MFYGYKYIERVFSSPGIIICPKAGGEAESQVVLKMAGKPQAVQTHEKCGHRQDQLVM
jgi:hypothetical protein